MENFCKRVEKRVERMFSTLLHWFVYKETVVFDKIHTPSPVIVMQGWKTKFPLFGKRVEKGWKTKTARLQDIFPQLEKGGKRVVPLFFPLFVVSNRVTE